MSDLHLGAQTTQKYGLPLSHLEYSYIEKCSDIKELEKILRILRSGDEGRYPDLERFTETRLESLFPKSRALRKDNPITKLGEYGSGDWQAIQQDLKEWSNDMHSKDNVNKSGGKAVKPQTDLYEGDENLPPVRSSNVVLEGKKRKETNPSQSNKKRVMPRDYKEWDKVDVDAELQKLDEAPEKKATTSNRTSVKGITDKLNGTGLSEEEKERKANREKDKGNEAYRSGDFEESVTYYSRSISLLPTAASYNNRALAYLKMETWDKAIKDCNIVLNLEKENVKALLRRGTAYKSKNQLSKGKSDFEKVLALEPNNKKAESLLNDVNKQLKEESKVRKEKGRRMVIEEVEESEEEEIEVEKEPMVNGYGNHNHAVKENGIHEILENGKEEKGKGESNKNLDNKKEQHSSQKKNNKKSVSKAAEPDKQLESNKAQPQGKVVCDSGDSSKRTNKDTKEKMCSQQHVSEMNTAPSSSLPVSLEEEVDARKTSAFLEKGDDGDDDKNKKAAAASEQHSNTDTAALSSSLSSLSSSSSSSSETADVDQTTYTSSSAESQAKTTVPTTLSMSSSLSSPLAAENSSSSSPNTSMTGAISSEIPSPSFTRPVLVQLPLPTQVSKLKGEGNNLFRSGQYSSALQIYSQAIALLEKDPAQSVNLSLLLSNRAACNLKTGNSSDSVKDCGRSLEFVPHSLKSLLRRAAAYESLEIFGKAYVDYKHVLSIDMSVDQASQGASRCQRMLQDIHGQKCWREKIPSLTLVQPWEVPVIVDQANQSSAVLATAAPTTRSESSPSESNGVSSVPKEKVSTSEKKETPQPSKEEKFEQLKASGNSHVQKGEYSEAEVCYSSCIALCPEQVACYTNRALCYIKLNKPTEAEVDCDKALSLQPDNPKALYRRALARKMLQRYKLSMQDLVELLKLEPKNKAASSEMEIVKNFYREEFEQLKQKKQESDGKVRKRMKIEEVDDDDDEEKSGRSKTQAKSQSKSRSGKSNQPPSVVKSKGTNQTSTEKKQAGGKETSSSSQGMPVAPPSAPRLMKTTPYEFCQAWNSLKPTQGIQPYAEILRQISPSDLPSVISNKLDGQMLQIIVRCVYEEMVLKGEVDKGYQILDYLCKVPRFSTVSMFLSGKEKKEVSSVLDILVKTGSNAYSKADILRLKKEYSVK